MAMPLMPRTRSQALQRLRMALVEKKLTQAELAEAADCHEKTVQNLLNGRMVRDQTLFDVAMVLGLDFDELKALWAGPGGQIHDAPEPAENRNGASEPVSAPQAPLFMDAYTRAAVDHYIGSYLTVRPSFLEPGVIVAYRTDVAWDEATPALTFRESARPDPEMSHTGHVYVPPSSMFVHFVSLTKGAMRMVLAWQIDQSQCLRGLITTSSRAPKLMPVAAPIVYQKSERLDPKQVGRIDPAHDCFEIYRARLKEALADRYVQLIGP